jgi:ferredoxin
MNELTRFIFGWMSSPENNVIAPDSDLPAFDMPLIGCASAADPLFSFLKNDIGANFYWLPEEAFSLAYPGEGACAEELSVIAWILPQTEHTRQAHRLADRLPSIEWSQARHYGEMVNVALRKAVVGKFESEGIPACAPVLLPEWSRNISEKYSFASDWSERHAAYSCGLGTFGLSGGLITTAGKAVRVGSVIVRANFPPTPRPYTHHNEWCLFYAKGTCRACIGRCPAGAISESGHDKEKCKQYIQTVTAIHVEREQLGFRVNCCGFCQTRVPCEYRNPTKRLKSARRH